MIEIGEVVRLENDKVEVFFKVSNYCKECRVCGSDGGGEKKLMLDNTVGAKKGDRVEVFIPEGLILKGSFLVFILPLVVFLIAYLILRRLTGSELAGAVGGGVGFILTFYSLWLYEKKIKEIKRTTLPCILKLHKKEIREEQ